MLSSRWNTDDHGAVTGADAGYATVAAAGFAGVLVMLCGVIAWHAGAVVATAQAQQAADLAAVTGAYRIAMGEGTATACAASSWVTELNGAILRTCEVLGEDVTVDAVVRGRSAQARAGPM